MPLLLVTFPPASPYRPGHAPWLSVRDPEAVGVVSNAQA
jgi:hypothetical protein